jgi:hypothetical protein
MFAGHRLPLPPEVVESRPGLDQFFGAGSGLAIGHPQSSAA